MPGSGSPAPGRSRSGWAARAGQRLPRCLGGGDEHGAKRGPKARVGGQVVGPLLRGRGVAQAVEQATYRVDGVVRGQDRYADLLPGCLPGAGRVRPERGQAGERVEVLLGGVGRVERQGGLGEPDVGQRRGRDRGGSHVLLLSGAPASGRDTSGLVPRVKAASTPAPAGCPNAYTVRIAAAPPAVSSRTQAASSCPVALLYRRASRARAKRRRGWWRPRVPRPGSARAAGR